ncbi:hypothetical protein HPB52_007766 [Rhipicephalus sanguineus]|uniref:Uncharacterized protein n=1 Tax=Rhipicephalus sanguineus TaxID=34632 RepID=A0A9D4PUW8_RHISA|nr:hypothetical protein HPB52_007766 [Rhipicephalus sanguineus]
MSGVDSFAKSDENEAQSLAFKLQLMNTGEFGSEEFSLDAVRRLHRQVQYARASGVRTLTSQFVQPLLRPNGSNAASPSVGSSVNSCNDGMEECEALKNIDAKLIELVKSEVGEGEKMVRALFAVARSCQPAVVFIDEIDSLLSQRCESEHESSRRIKTEFLVQLDGASTKGDERLLIVGATNRPKELDEAARRRLAKRLYIPLPEKAARRQMVCRLLAQVKHCLSDEDIDTVVSLTQGYSGADMAQLCKEAALGPIRSLSFETLQHITAQQARTLLSIVRPVSFKDFEEALCQVRASVSQDDLHGYIEWNSMYGSTPAVPATD